MAAQLPRLRALRAPAASFYDAGDPVWAFAHGD